MATRTYEGLKFIEGREVNTLESLTIEEALQININKVPYTVTMRTPGDDLSLIRGLLHSEGVINDPSFQPKIILNRENSEGIVTVLDVEIPAEKLSGELSNSRNLLSVSSCGICGRTELGQLAFMGNQMPQIDEVDPSLLNEIFNQMNQGQEAFLKSGGTHAAAAFNEKGKLICLMEDIGRHNAVDKVIGWLLTEQKLEIARYLTVSGRISYEIVIKCYNAGIPCLAAVSAPSSLAVDYAKELGITLFGFCRDNRATCYSNVIRIKKNYQQNNSA